MRKINYFKAGLTLALTVLVFSPVTAFAFPDPPIAADDVVGQPDFVTNAEGEGLTGSSSPSGVAVDSIRHRLFFADSGNSRVLVYNLNSSNQLVNKTPDFVIGQEDFDSNEERLTRDGLNMDDGGIVFDEANNRLFVSDESNARIMVFNTTTITNGMDAAYVLGQEDFVSDDGDTDADSLDYNESTPSYDPARQLLFVPEYNNNRVLIFDVNSITNGEDAVKVLGQPDFVTDDSDDASATDFDLEYVGSVFDPTTKRFYLADSNNNRVLVFDTTTITNDEPAVNVLGQADFAGADEGLSQSTLDEPTGLAIDTASQTLYVNDSDNYRILAFDVTSITNGENAVGVIGQPDFVTNEDESEDSATEYTVSAGNATNLWFEGTTNQLFVPDMGNNRLLIYGINTGDSDGIDSAVENAAPNGGDGNNDGTADSSQANVVSLVSSETGKYTTLALDDACVIESASIVNEADNAAKDSGYKYTAGLVNFTADCGEEGFTTSVTLYQYGLKKDGLKLRKFNPNTNAYFTITDATIAQTTIDEQVVATATYSITDGGELDVDDAENGIIVDPVGLGVQDAVTPNTGLAPAPLSN